MECNSILAHPKLPLLFVLTKDGRVLCIAVQIKIRPPDNPEDGHDGNLFTFLYQLFVYLCKLNFFPKKLVEKMNFMMRKITFLHLLLKFLEFYFVKPEFIRMN